MLFRPPNPHHMRRSLPPNVLLVFVHAQIFRHTDFKVATQAVDTLVFCSRSGPGALQPIARLALSSAVNKALQGVTSAARAVLQLPEQELQAEVEELESAGGSSCESVGINKYTRCAAGSTGRGGRD